MDIRHRYNHRDRLYLNVTTYWVSYECLLDVGPGTLMGILIAIVVGVFTFK